MVLPTVVSENLPVTDTGCLLVCLCDEGSLVPLGPILARWCDAHNGITLRSLVDGGLHSLLHVTDDAGKIVPLTAAMLRSKS